MDDRDVIAVGIDYSDCSRRAFGWAVEEALLTHRRLRLVHVTRWSDDTFTLVPRPSADVLAHRSASRLLQRYALQARRSGIEDVRIRVLEGDPAETLPRAAEDTAMLVVGSHGRSAVTSALLGTVSRGCIRHATCPVVVVPAPTTPLRHTDKRTEVKAR